MTLAPLILAAALSATAAKTGQMSPTSDVSSNRVKASGSTTYRSNAARWADVVNVKDYGATGDGATDDAAAINAAITAAPAGGTVFLPADTYYVSTTITIGKALHLRGSGKTSSILHAHGGYPVIRINSASTVANVTLRDLRINVSGATAASQGVWAGDGTHYAAGLHFESLTIDADNAVTGSSGIHLQFGLIGKIDRVDVSRWGYGLYLESTASAASNAIEVSGGSEFSLNRIGVYGSADSVRLTHAVIEGNVIAGIQMTGGSWTLTGNHIENADPATDIWMSASSKVAMFGNDLFGGTGAHRAMTIDSGVGSGAQVISHGDQWQGTLFNDTTNCDAFVYRPKNPVGLVTGGAGGVAYFSASSLVPSTGSSFTLTSGANLSIVPKNGWWTDIYATGGGYVSAYTVRGISATSTQAKNMRGSATFATSNSVAVTFGTAETDATYFVSLAGSANETFWVTNKGTGGFTLHSSNASSTATVDWILIR